MVALGACGQGDGSSSVGAGSPWCDAVRVAVGHLERIRAGDLPEGRDEIMQQVQANGRMMELAPESFRTAPSMAAKGATVRTACGDELADAFEGMLGPDSDAELVDAPLAPVEGRLDVDVEVPFQVTGSPMILRADGLCPARDLAVELRPGATSVASGGWVDEDGVLELHVDLPVDLTGGTYTVVATAPEGENEYGRACPEERLETVPFLVRERSTLDPATEW